MLVDISPHFFRLVSSILPPPPASRGRTAPPPIKIHGPPIQVHGISASPPPASGTSPASPHVRLAQCKSLSHAGCLTLCLRKVKKTYFVVAAAEHQCHLSVSSILSAGLWLYTGPAFNNLTTWLSKTP